MAAPLVVLLGSTAPEQQPLAGDAPTALRGDCALADAWWRALGAAGLADPALTYVVTNAAFYKSFEFWAFGRGLALPHVINSGRSVGDARVNLYDLAQALRLADRQQEHLGAASPRGVLVVALDSAPSRADELAGALQALVAASQGDASAQLASSAAAASTQPPPLAFHLSAAHAALVRDPAAVAAIAVAHAGAADPVTGEPAALPIEALFSHLRSSGSSDSGAASVVQVASPAAGWRAAHDAAGALQVVPAGIAYGRAFARVGVLGNPSDGYGGKTTATTVSNFLAEAWVSPTSDGRVELVPHPLFDPLRYASVAQLATIATREGYSGGVRLMAATLNRLHQHMAARGVQLPAERGFSLRYHTTVPRQVGLAGSSALVTAMLRALLAFYGYASEDARGSVGLPRDRLASFVLQIEAEELGITAGLQDRVVQAYEGLVHMDFRVDTLRANDGMGVYTQLPVAALPPLFLAYAADPSDSGRIHAPVKQRWLAGDAEVVAGMNRIAALADEALALCTKSPYSAASSVSEREAIVSAWAAAFRSNFDNRRTLFGDGALGRDNIRMVEISRECGASGKFPGSGGAIVGVVDVAGIEATGKLPAGTPPAAVNPSGASPDEAADVARVSAARVAAATAVLREAYHAEGFVFIRLRPVESATPQV